MSGLKISTIVGKTVKARIVSWLTDSPTPAALPTIDGSKVIIAMYVSGKRVQPEIIQMPGNISEMPWGPDGPANYNKPPEGHEHGPECEGPAPDKPDA